MSDASIDDVLTPRLAARFERALVLDEEGGRAPQPERSARLGRGLFEAAMAARATTTMTTTVAARFDGATAPSDEASRRALTTAAFACGSELVNAPVGGATTVPEVDGEARLERARALPMSALLDEAIAITTEVAARVGDDAALAWYVATAPRVDARLASIALGVIACVPATRRHDEPTAFAVRFARARDAVAERRRAIGKAAELRTRRASAIAEAADAARAATSAAIEGELAATLRAIAQTHAREVAAVERWHAQEQPLGAADARIARDAAIARAEGARRSAIERAHEERLAALATHHAAAMVIVDRAQAAYDAATAGRDLEVEAARARWERELASIARIEEDAIRARLTRQGLERVHAEREAARKRAGQREVEARDERDAVIARARGDEESARSLAEVAYHARVDEAERAYEAAVRDAERAFGDAAKILARAAASRRAAIEASAIAATRAAHERAAMRRARDIDTAGATAARERAAAIDAELTALDGVGAGTHGEENRNG